MKEYTVTIGGIEHTLLLDDEDAEARGAKPVQHKASVPANKSRSTDTKARD